MCQRPGVCLNNGNNVSVLDTRYQMKVQVIEMFLKKKKKKCFWLYVLDLSSLPSKTQGDPLEKEMAAHSSPLAWKIPWTEEPGELQSTEPQRIGHNWAHTQSNVCWELPLTQKKPPSQIMAFLSKYARLHSVSCVGQLHAFILFFWTNFPLSTNFSDSLIFTLFWIMCFCKLP